MPWAQNLSILVYIELFVGTLKILNHMECMMEYCSTDMMEYCSTDKAYAMKQGNLPLLSKSLYTNILYSIVMSNPRMLHVFLDVQVLVLTAYVYNPLDASIRGKYSLYTFFYKKTIFFWLSFNFLNIMLESRLRFS